MTIPLNFLYFNDTRWSRHINYIHRVHLSLGRYGIIKPVTHRLLLAILILFVTTPDIQSQCPPIYIFTGEAAGDELGRSVASAGDVNNDGFADLIVGAWFNDAGGVGAGRAYVFSGLNGDTLHIFTGARSFDGFGVSVASAGDVNNDGYADLIVGASGNNAGGLNAGRAYVYSGLNGNILHIFTGEAAGDSFGSSVASAGDVNNDDYADLFMGAPGNDAAGDRAGRSYVFSGLNGDSLYVFSGEAAGDGLGSVASAGDINHDGYADLIVGAVGNDAGGSRAGRAYVFSGQTGDTLHVFTGEAAGDGFGLVASAGDVNNDGYADLIVGAPQNDAGGSNAGRAYVFSGLNGDILHIFTGERGDVGFSPGDRFGNTVASAGDVNNDDYADLIVGARLNDASFLNAGRAYVFSGLDGDTLYLFNGEVVNELFGSTVASAGDVNNDGYTDLFVSAPLSRAGGDRAGRAYVFLTGNLICGDVNRDGIVTQDDLTFLFNFYFSFDESPCGFTGDVNDDGNTDIADIVSLANFLNGIGPAPCSGGEPPPKFDQKREPDGRAINDQ